MRNRKFLLIPCLLPILLLTFFLSSKSIGAQAVQAASAAKTCNPWSVVSSPNPGNDSNTLAGVVAVSTGNVWAVGSTQTNGVVQTLTEHWNGSQWSVVASPGPAGESQLSAVTVVPGTKQLWAVGEYFDTYWHTLTLHWDGSQWVLVPSPNVGTAFNFLTGVTAISKNDVWAVGNVYNGSNTTTLTMHWAGSQWSIVASPNPSSFYNTLNAVSYISKNDVWGVGASNGGSSQTSLIEHWDGTSWSVVASPSPSAGSSGLNAITRVPGTKQLWAAGSYFATPNSSTPLALIEKWDGKQWSVVSSPSPGAGFNVLQGVVALSAKDVWAVGYESPGEIPIVTLVEHWDGTSWSLVSSPNPDNADTFYAVTRVPGTHRLWAVGGSNGQGGMLTEAYCQ